jgi:hypothetical protein
MNPRTTAILALVAAALGAFVWFYQVRGGERRAEAEENAKRLFPGLEADAVTAMEFVTSDGEEVRLERREGVWFLTRPLESPADENTVSGMASALAQISSEGSIEESQAAEVYGLGEGAAQVRFETAEGGHTLLLGGKTPVDYNTYASVDDAPGVYTVPSYRAGSFERALLDLRERRVLRFDREAAEKIDARWPGGGVVLEKRGDGWHLASPLETAADAQTVDDLLANLTFLRADGFVDDPGSEGDQGFEEPAFEVSVWTRTGEGAELSESHLVMGAAMPGAVRRMRGAETSLYEVPSERINDFPRRVAAYRFRTLGEFAASAAASLLIEFPATPDVARITATLGDNGWTSEPEALAPGKLARIVTELSRLRAEDIEADEMGERELAALGLVPPRVRLQALAEAPEAGGDPEVLASVELGSFDTTRGILARVPDSPIVYRLDYALAEHLPLTHDALRNRFLSNQAPADGSDAEPDAAPGLELPPLE